MMEKNMLKNRDGRMPDSFENGGNVALEVLARNKSQGIYEMLIELFQAIGTEYMRDQ